MARILLTGMSGAGKTTVLRELSRRGHVTVDTDEDAWVLADGTWDETRIAALLEEESSMLVSGTVENQGSFYDRFECVVLLSAPIEVLIERVSTRRDNPYGRSVADQTSIRQDTLHVEPLLRSGAMIELDGRLPVPTLADHIEHLISRFDVNGPAAHRHPNVSRSQLLSTAAADPAVHTHALRGHIWSGRIAASG